ncbi:CRISPR-associated protein Csm2 [Gammaproteobacteria bacterium]
MNPTQKSQSTPNRNPGGGFSGTQSREGSPTLQQSPSDISKIKFDKIDADLFDKTAKDMAIKLALNPKSNKPTQLRRFYDEICMWNERVEMEEKRFDELLPFIRMINAKAAYAKGRNGLVDDNFVNLIRHCLSEVKDPKTMKNFKLFMEAVMGFYKEQRPKDS